MDFEQLRTFVVLARNKSFSKTADALHLVQSTVSSRIQGLETEIGKPLFMRDRRRVELTEAGYAFLPYAERLLLLSEESLTKIRSLKRMKTSYPSAQPIPSGNTCCALYWRPFLPAIHPSP